MEMICEACGKDVSRQRNVYYFNGHTLCRPSCAKLLGYVKCSVCHEWHTPDEVKEVVWRSGTVHVCKKCRARHCVYCKECGHWAMRGDGHSRVVEMVDGTKARICTMCLHNEYFRCDKCGKFDKLTRQKRYTNKGFSLPCCEECAETMHKCGLCGQLTKESYEDNLGRDVCYGCMEACNDELSCANIMEHGSFKDYSFRYLKTESNLKRFFGLELEIEQADKTPQLYRGKTAARLNAMGQGSFYIERDGSLKDHGHRGLEIISDPYSARYFEERLSRRLEDMMAYAKSEGWEADTTSTCGLHFHVSRDSLSEDTLAKLLMLFDKFKGETFALSRRSDIYSFERWACPTHVFHSYSITPDECWMDDKFNEMKRRMRGGQYSNNRYRSLNLTNSKTVEVRIFRSTLEIGILRADFHMVEALIKIAETSSAKETYEMPRKEFIARLTGYGSPELKSLVESCLHTDTAA